MESSKRPSKYHLSINFLAQKKTAFPSPESSKHELFSNQYISSFHQLFDSKKDRISHLRKVQKKNFPVISKYHLYIDFLAQKSPYFHIWKVQNTNFSVISKHDIPCYRKCHLIVFLRTERSSVSGLKISCKFPKY